MRVTAPEEISPKEVKKLKAQLDLATKVAVNACNLLLHTGNFLPDEDSEIWYAFHRDAVTPKRE